MSREIQELKNGGGIFVGRAIVGVRECNLFQIPEATQR